MVFTQDNTHGYTDNELDVLNRVAKARVPALMERYGLDEDEAGKAFADAVGHSHGIVEKKNLKYILTDQAQLTNNVFPNWFGDVKEGEEYISQWSAPALDRDGIECTVYWEFTETKGQETEPSLLNWDVVYRIRY